MEIWNLVFMQDEVDERRRGRARRCPARTSTPAPALERVAMVAAGRRQRLRDRPVPPHRSRRSQSAVGQALRRGRARRRLPPDRGRARPRHDVPDRRRRAAVERGPRLHPAPDAAPRRSRTRGGWAIEGPRDGVPSSTSVQRRVRRRLPGAARERGVRARRWPTSEEERFSATLRQGVTLFEEAKGARRRAAVSGDDAFAAHGHVRVPAASSRRSWRTTPGSRSTPTGSPNCCRNSSERVRARRREEGRRSVSTRAPSRPRSSSATSRPEAEGADRVGPGRGEPRARGRRRGPGRSGSSWTARRSTPRAAVRWGTRA